MVGTLMQVAFGRTDPDVISEILEARDRGRAGPTAPAHGLTLARVRIDPGPVVAAWPEARVDPEGYGRIPPCR